MPHVTQFRLALPYKAFAAGTIAKYVGSRTEDTWTMRVAAGFEDEFQIPIADRGFQKKRKSREMLEEAAMDPDNEDFSKATMAKTKRAMASKRMTRLEVDEWRRRGLARLELPKAKAYRRPIHFASMELSSCRYGSLGLISACTRNRSPPQRILRQYLPN